MSVMVSAAMTRPQALREMTIRPLRVHTVERHGGVHRDQLISLQQEDPKIQGLMCAKKTSRVWNKIVSFEKIKGHLVSQIRGCWKKYQHETGGPTKFTARIRDVGDPR
ncbi:hypothetical protein PoB_004035000 [Plakobranchus ocellatus]|uniref:Uncharacterized protein n=1 Tax=Plakobranchus ocellatus TaxID=259542 RepID=A0AAV4B436_9GAST|nr:hypothetical protein PoB_004035000 [Plakobranchus ocellatus]